LPASVQSLLAVGGFGNREAVVLQDAARDLAHDAAVIDNQTGFHYILT
jgi:hypothetical protein